MNRAQGGSDTGAEVVEKGFLSVFNVTDVFATIPNEGWTPVGLEGVDERRSVAEVAKRLIGKRLTHGFVAGFPIAAVAVEVSAAGHDGSVDARFNGSGDRENKRSH